MKKSLLAVFLFIASQFIGYAIAAVIFLIPHLSEMTDMAMIAQWFRSITPDTDTGISILIASLLISQILLFLIFTAAHWLKPADLVKAVPVKTFLLCIPLLVAAILVLNMLNSALGLPDTGKEQFMKMVQSPWGILSIALTGPVTEEIVFRRITIDNCLKSTGKGRTAIIISAFLFGLIHLNPAQMVFAFCVGILFGWIYLRTGSMMPGVIGHIINNTIGVIEMRAVTDMMPDDTRFYQEPLYLAIFIACSVLSVLLIAIIDRTCPKMASHSNGSSLHHSG